MSEEKKHALYLKGSIEFSWMDYITEDQFETIAHRSVYDVAREVIRDALLDGDAPFDVDDPNVVVGTYLVFEKDTEPRKWQCVKSNVKSGHQTTLSVEPKGYVVNGVTHVVD